MTGISYAACHSSFLLFLFVRTFCSSLEPWLPSSPPPLLLVLCFILIKRPEQSGENPPQPHLCISLTLLCLPPVTALPSLPSPNLSCTRLISAYSEYKLQHFSLFLCDQSPPSLLNRSPLQYRCPLSLPHCNTPGGRMLLPPPVRLPLPFQQVFLTRLCCEYGHGEAYRFFLKTTSLNASHKTGQQKE